MTVEQKNQLILDFINGPLREYLQDEISFGKFKERVNETCGTNFSYSDIYPSWLFNGKISYPEEESLMKENYYAAVSEYNNKMSQCHAYGLCARGDTNDFPCEVCPGKNNAK